MDIKDASKEDLQKELIRRAEFEKKKSIPQPLENIDTDSILEFAIAVRDEIVQGLTDEDNDHWAYECVMMAVFGKDYFDWQNKNT